MEKNQQYYEFLDKLPSEELTPVALVNEFILSRADANEIFYTWATEWISSGDSKRLFPDGVINFLVTLK